MGAASTRRLLLIGTAALALRAPAGHAQEAEGLRADLRGYFRSRLSLFSPLEGDDSNLELRVRPELVVYVTEKLSATVTTSAERRLGRSEGALGPGEFRVERAFFDYKLKRLDLRVGRQAINLGSALIWNPVDLVDANTPFDSAVEKRGIDAVRASYSLSSTASVLGVLGFPDRSTLSLLRGQALLGGTEVALIAAENGPRQDRVLGLDLKGDLGVGFWVEGAYHFEASRKAYDDVVVGIDYSLPVFERLYLAGQYRHDGSGGTGVTDYDYAAWLAGRRAFLARQYGSLTARVSFDETTTATANVVYNIEDRSLILTLGMTRYFFDNLEANAHVNLLRGKGPGEFNPAKGSPLAGRLPTESYELWLEWRF